MDKETIEHLAQRSRYDKEALGALYDYFFPKIFAYVGWRTDVRADTEDVVSDIFMKMVKYIETYESKETGSFQAWLYRIARTTVIDHYRTRRPTLTLEDAADLLFEQRDLVADFDMRAAFKKTMQALEKLPERQAEIIRLRFVAELSNQEIAVILNIGEKSVSAAIAKGFARIRDILGNV